MCCSQAVAGHARMHSVQVKVSLLLPFWFFLKLVSVPEFALSVLASSSKWIKVTESLARPLYSSQKEWINEKEQILPTERICWNPSLGLWSANAPRKTGEIIISNLKSHIDTKKHCCLSFAAVQYNPKGFGWNFIFVSEVAFCEVIFLKVLCL